MKLAYSTLACPKWSLEQIIDAATRNGYEDGTRCCAFGNARGEPIPAAVRAEENGVMMA